MSIDIKKLANNIISEGLAVDSSSAYAYPSPENESEVLLALTLGIIARNCDKYVRGAKLDDKQHDAMITAGTKVIDGSTSPEAYVKKIDGMLKADLNDMAKNQIVMRLMFSYGKNKGVKAK